MMAGRVVVAMSGGVDSSVAAALLVEAGYQVVGVMMRLWSEGENQCCDPQAVEDARRVSEQLQIPFHLVDYRKEFKANVVDRFITEYSRGRTPNPCLACNKHIRFGYLLRYARDLGASHLATGHYAQVVANGARYQLRMGADLHKDQSYVLHMLGQHELEQLLFPVGSYLKSEIREIARQWGLPVASKAESMDICFVRDGDYRRFLAERVPEAVRPGPILDVEGREIGRHNGLPFYTIGQRRGIKISASEALYVIRLDTEFNAVVVGPAQALGRQSLTAEDVSYVSGALPSQPLRVQAKIRYKAVLADAMWHPLEGGRVRVDFDAPRRDVTPGQAVVAYQGDVLIGGGIISS